MGCEILVSASDELDAGFIVALSKTKHLLEKTQSLTGESEWGDPVRIPVPRMWHVPDHLGVAHGTTIGGKYHRCW